MSGQSWAFVLDGHVFYVLSDISGRTLVCDLTTGQWHHWFTGEEPGLWNMYRGMMWKGIALAGDAEGPQVWWVDPRATTDAGDALIHRAVTGFLPARGRASYRQGSLRLSASIGDPDVEGAEIRLRISDDEGETWGQTYSVAIKRDAFEQPISFRSLGRMRAPGRIWEITDAGGLVRIDGVDSDMEAPA